MWMISALFFNDTATTEIYTLSLHDALPIFLGGLPAHVGDRPGAQPARELAADVELDVGVAHQQRLRVGVDRKSTRLNSSHANISYAVFCLKKKNQLTHRPRISNPLIVSHQH